MQQPYKVAQPQLSKMPKYLFLTMRPKQWVKNIFVFAGLIFANDMLLTNPQSLVRVLATFGLWCLIASSIYLINDLVDVEKDRDHPKKRYRPLASGHLAPSSAIIATLIFLGIGLPLAYMLSRGVAIILAVYVVMQLAYSFRLKHVVILDVFIIAAGFVFRTVSGAVVLRIDISPWSLNLYRAVIAVFGARQTPPRVSFARKWRGQPSPRARRILNRAAARDDFADYRQHLDCLYFVYAQPNKSPCANQSFPADVNHRAICNLWNFPLPVFGL